MMNKIHGDPGRAVPEMLEEYAAMYPALVERMDGVNGLLMRELPEARVSLVTGGGAGNEPWCIGCVGEGMAAAAAVGAVYAAPPARTIVRVAQGVPHERGVLFLANNHAGDVLNFELAAELAELEGVRSRCVFVHDDIASAPRERREERRGVAGALPVLKVAGAACAAGHSLEEAERIARKADRYTATLGVTTSPGYLPGGRAMFDMEPGTISYGMGFNGEPGILTTPLVQAGEIGRTLVELLAEDLGLTKQDEVAVLVNGYGFTSYLELCVLSRSIRALLSRLVGRIHDQRVETLFCPQGTGGASLTVLRLDPELRKYYDMPARTPCFAHNPWKEADR